MRKSITFAAKNYNLLVIEGESRHEKYFQSTSIPSGSEDAALDGGDYPCAYGGGGGRNYPAPGATRLTETHRGGVTTEQPTPSP